MPRRSLSPALRKRGGLHAEADAGRGAGDDDVAGQQRHEAADVGHQFGAAEDHVGGRAVLHAGAVQIQPEMQVLRIGDLVGGDQPRSERAEAVAALALVPLRAAFELVFALGDVVGDAVAGDVLERALDGNVPRDRTDDDRQFDFPVGLERARRQQDRVARTADAGGGLHEEDRFARDRHAGFPGVVAVVEADADDLADAGERHAEARIAFHARQRFRRDAAQAVQPLRRECRLVDGLDGRRQVAQLALAVDEAGLFAAIRAIAYELHRGPAYQ